MKQFDRGVTISQDDMIETLKTINRAAQHRARTWSLYADRMGRWLVSTGLAIAVHGGWQLQDRGDVRIPNKRRMSRSSFSGDAPPRRVVEALTWLCDQKHVSRGQVKERGFRNAFTVLARLGLTDLSKESNDYFPSPHVEDVTPIEAVWRAARNDATLNLVIEFLNVHPSAGGAAIAEYINEAADARWLNATKLRIGNGLRRWGVWLMQPTDGTTTPDPPKDESRKNGKVRADKSGPTLFDDT